MALGLRRAQLAATAGAGRRRRSRPPGVPTHNGSGVTEALKLWLGMRLGSQVGGSGPAVRLVVGAGLGTKVVDWTVRPLLTLVAFGSDPAGANVNVRVRPAVLCGWTWGRSDEEHLVDIVGDQEAADEVRALLGCAQQWGTALSWLALSTAARYRAQPTAGPRVWRPAGHPPHSCGLLRASVRVVPGPKRPLLCATR